MKKKRAFTLLEIMIVIFLIGLIGSVIGYNMKGSLDQGKAFKTKQAMIKIRDLLELEIARSDPSDLAKVGTEAGAYLKKTGVVKNADKLLKDGWGGKIHVVVNEHGEVSVTSEKYSAYLKKMGQTDDLDD